MSQRKRKGGAGDGEEEADGRSQRDNRLPKYPILDLDIVACKLCGDTPGEMLLMPCGNPDHSACRACINKASKGKRDCLGIYCCFCLSVFDHKTYSDLRPDNSIKECPSCHSTERPVVKLPCLLEDHSSCEKCIINAKANQQCPGIFCVHCNEAFDYKTADDLWPDARHAVLATINCNCPHGTCAWTGPAVDFQSHVEEDCLSVVTACPVCDGKHPRRAMGLHIKNNWTDHVKKLNEEMLAAVMRRHEGHVKLLGQATDDVGVKLAQLQDWLATFKETVAFGDSHFEGLWAIFLPHLESLPVPRGVLPASGVATSSFMTTLNTQIREHARQQQILGQGRQLLDYFVDISTSRGATVESPVALDGDRYMACLLAYMDVLADTLQLMRSRWLDCDTAPQGNIASFVAQLGTDASSQFPFAVKRLLERARRLHTLLPDCARKKPFEKVLEQLVKEPLALEGNEEWISALLMRNVGKDGDMELLLSLLPRPTESSDGCNKEIQGLEQALRGQESLLEDMWLDNRAGIYRQIIERFHCLQNMVAEMKMVVLGGKCAGSLTCASYGEIRRVVEKVYALLPVNRLLYTSEFGNMGLGGNFPEYLETLNGEVNLFRVMCGLPPQDNFQEDAGYTLSSEEFTLRRVEEKPAFKAVFDFFRQGTPPVETILDSEEEE